MEKFDFLNSTILRLYTTEKRSAASQMTLKQFIMGGREVEREYYRAIIDNIRAEEDEAKQKKMKTALPMAWIAAKSASGFRTINAISEVTGIISADIDYDDGDNKKIFDKHGIEIVKKLCLNMWRRFGCFCAMKSCRGRGLVFYFYCDGLTKDNYGAYINWISTKLIEGQHLTLDKQAKDITRTRFLSYDDNTLFADDEFEPLHLDDEALEEYKTTIYNNEAESPAFDLSKINNIDDLEYLNNDGRWQYAYRLVADGFSREDAINIVKTRYDLTIGKKYSDINKAKAKQQDAYLAIEGAVDDAIKKNIKTKKFEWVEKELELLGWVKKEEKKEEKKNHAEQRELSNRGNGKEIKEWLSEYEDEIKQSINENDVICIEAPTGTGKTTLIKKLAKEYNGIILTPFLSMRGLYEESNEKVDVDEMDLFFNEYKNDNIDLINSADEYMKDVNRAVVMVYDRLTKINDVSIYNKTIFIDESHILFTDRSYRDRLVVLMDKLNRLLEENKIKLILISATPLAEVDILRCTKRLRYWKKREMIKLTWENCDTLYEKKNKLYDTVRGFLWYNKDYYDRLVVFSDSSTRFIYDKNCFDWGDMAHEKFDILHSGYKEYGDLDRIRETEILTKPVTLTTCLGFNGLNFRNADEKICVVIDFSEGVDLSWKIIQAAGRLRQATVDVLVINCMNKSCDIDRNEELTKFYKKYDIDNELFRYSVKYDNADIVRAMRQINDYNTEHSKYDIIIKDLEDTGYFEIDHDIKKNSCIDYNCKLRNNPLRKYADEAMYKDIIDNKFSEEREDLNTYDVDSIINEGNAENTYINNEPVYDYTKYYNELKTKIQTAMKNFDFDVNVLKMAIEKKYMTSVNTTIDNIIRIFSWAMTDEDRMADNINRIMTDMKEMDPINQKRILEDINTIHKISEKYTAAKNIGSQCKLLQLTGGKICKTALVGEYRKAQIENMEKAKVKNSEAGKKGGQKGGQKGGGSNKQSIIIDGIKYDSKTAAYKALGRRYVDSILKNGKKIIQTMARI